jgi:pimeloyl-ACP methyl ester carboxylesterase
MQPVLKTWFWALTFVAILTSPYEAAPQRNGGRYADVSGLRMYYEIHGAGRPLVLLHGGGSTIQSTFGRILPTLAKRHRVIAVELQAHGHTRDIDRPLTFEQDADDVAELLRQLRIAKADFMGFSNGGMSTLQMAMRHPALVNRLVLVSTPYRRDGMQEGFWEGLQQATLAVMPKPLKDAYLKANPDPHGLQRMFERDQARMLAFKDFSETDLRRIQALTLIINGDTDVVRPEHAVALSRLLPHARLVILPGGHGEAIGEAMWPRARSAVQALVTAIIREFLAAT